MRERDTSVRVLMLVAFLLPISGLWAGKESAGYEFFEIRVRPLLSEKCFKCHSQEASKAGKLKAGLLLDSRSGLLRGGDSGAALIPGSPSESLFIEAIHYRSEDLEMPPAGKLSAEQIEYLTKWVAMGAPWPGAEAESDSETSLEESVDQEKLRLEHWAYKPRVAPPIPEVAERSWPKTPIDAFVLAKLERAGLSPNAPANRGELIRRAWLTLVGTPPSPSDIERFVADSSEYAFGKVVDQLLDSVQYGERWARHWLDIARYSDGYGGFGDGAPLPKAWQYRDWVVNALNADLPYDEFVRRQIAGDLLKRQNRDAVGTGFFVVGPTYRSDGGDPEAQAQAQAETLSDRVDTFGRAFLALTAACARCHDHKFDPITTQDYYAIAGIFKNTRNGEHPLVSQAIVADYQSGQNAIKEQKDVIKQFLDAEAKRIGKNHQEAEKQLRPELKSQLAELRAELTRRQKVAPAKYPFAHILVDSGNSDMHVALRGDLRKKGELVPRRFLTMFSSPNAKYETEGTSGRRQLAESVVHPENPLTARVIVNRVWQWHFGEGLVRTPSNFGALGEKPSHPELLDWLASDFIEKGWSLKRLHRQIMLSSTWQMSSAYSKEKFDRDGDNRLLWRMSPRKLDVEAWRDSLLSVTGELDSRLGGAPVNDILGSTRRTLYSVVSRTGDRFESDSFLRLFDFPAAVSTSPQRAVSTVPQQYLFMLNSKFMKERAAALSRHWLLDSSPLPIKVDQLYRTLYCRPATEAEIRLAEDWLEEGRADKWEQYAQALLSAHEFIQLR